MLNFYFVIGTIVVFFILLFIVERKASFKIILRTVLTILVLYLVYAFGVLNYINTAILMVAVVLIVSFLNIFIKEGFHRKAVAEFLSLLICSLLACGLVLLICKITGTTLSYTDENLNSGTNINGMTFAIAVTIMLGIFTDVISNIVSRLDEEKDKAEDVTWRQQFKLGNEIGRAIINERINMLLMLFAGVTLFPICLYISNGYSLMDCINNNYIFFTFMCVFIGNIVILLSVPITSFIYGTMNRKKIIYKTTSENRLQDGKRSLKL